MNRARGLWLGLPVTLCLSSPWTNPRLIDAACRGQDLWSLFAYDHPASRLVESRADGPMNRSGEDGPVVFSPLALPSPGPPRAARAHRQWPLLLLPLLLPCY